LWHTDPLLGNGSKQIITQQRKVSLESETVKNVTIQSEPSYEGNEQKHKNLDWKVGVPTQIRF
jgi:hypothetical protein